MNVNKIVCFEQVITLNWYQINWRNVLETGRLEVGIWQILPGYDSLEVSFLWIEKSNDRICISLGAQRADVQLE